ncbi:MAG: FAD-dependent oxidoreductase, partial [Planctomycetota bacterium]
LAGDFVQTGWPATMEGATRSGYRAAAAALGLDLDTFILPASTPALGVRLLGGPGLRDQHVRPTPGPEEGACDIEVSVGTPRATTAA